MKITNCVELNVAVRNVLRHHGLQPALRGDLSRREGYSILSCFERGLATKITYCGIPSNSRTAVKMVQLYAFLLREAGFQTEYRWNIRSSAVVARPGRRSMKE